MSDFRNFLFQIINGYHSSHGDQGKTIGEKWVFVFNGHQKKLNAQILFDIQFAGYKFLYLFVKITLNKILTISRLFIN
jgi:hypothetical protein